MNSQRVLYAIEIPPKFQADILAGRQPTVQIDVDATAAAQAFNGMTYIQNVIMNYATDFISGREGLTAAPLKMVTQVKFNPNLEVELVHLGDGDRQQPDHDHGHAHRRCAHSRARARHGRAPACDACRSHRDHALQDPGQWRRHCGFDGNIAGACRRVVAAGTGRRIASTIPGRRVRLRVHCRSTRHCSRHHRINDGPVRPAFNSSVAGHDAAFRQHDSAGKHAGVAEVPHAWSSARRRIS